MPEHLQIEITKALDQLKTSKYIADEPDPEEVAMKKKYEQAMESLSKYK